MNDGAAPATLRVAQVPGMARLDAWVSPAQSTDAWTACWTVYGPVGRYSGAQTLRFHAVPASSGHPRQIKLVVSDPQTGEPLQALSLACG